MTERLTYEEMAATLEKTGDYKVLRRLSWQSPLSLPDNARTKLGVFLDLETTGLDPNDDEIIEFGMLPFTYSLDGRIFEIGDAFNRLRQPSGPIPDQVVALTGITDQMVSGKTVEPEEVEKFVRPAALIIAHNAAFDRKFCERFSDVFRNKPWACSMSQVPWREEGVEGLKLKFLAAEFGFFFDGHRAVDDCLAGLTILSRSLPISRETALSRLLSEARRKSVRIFAEGAPYDARRLLKMRGYRWSDGSEGLYKCWWKEVADNEVATEMVFLREHVYMDDNAAIPTCNVDAYNRFSDRL